jgi:hypothetical protein
VYNQNKIYKKNFSLGKIVAPVVLALGLYFGANASENDSVAVKDSTAKSSQVENNKKQKTKKEFKADAFARGYFLGNRNCSGSMGAGLGISRTRLGMDIGGLVYDEGMSSEGLIEGGDYSLNEGLKLSASNIGAEANTRIDNSEIMAGIKAAKDRSDINSTYSDSMRLSQSVNGIDITDVMKTKVLDDTKIENWTMQYKAGTSRKLLDDILNLGMYMGITANKSESNSLRTVTQDVNETTSIDTVINGYDSTIVLDRFTATSDTSRDTVKITSKNRAYMLNPFAVFDYNNFVLRGDFIYVITDESKSSENGNTKWGKGYKAISLSGGLHFWKLFLSTQLGFNTDFDNFKLMQAFYLSDKKPQSVISDEFSGIQSNRMTNDLEKSLAASATDERLGSLKPSIRALSVIDRYKLLKSRVELNQLMLGYESMKRFGMEGSLTQAAIALQLFEKGDVSAFFAAEAGRLKIGDERIFSLSPEITANYGEFFGTVKVNVNKQGNESTASVGLSVGLEPK